jgi:hypothetical protein
MRILPLLSDRIRKVLLDVIITALGMLALWSCQLGQDPKVEDLCFS